MTRSPNNSNEAGSTLVAAVLVAAVMMGVTYLYFVSSWDGMTFASDRVNQDRILYLAEAGVGEGIDHLNGGGGAQVIDRIEDATWSYRVRIVDRGIGSAGQEIFEIASSALSGNDVRTVHAVVENLYRAPTLGAAVQAGEKCYLVRNTTVDGRDHDSLGLGFTGPGIYGVGAEGVAVMINHPSVGGRGIAPIVQPVPEDGVYRSNIPFGNGLDDDGDGAVDEERFDGLDNDVDGLIDEDLAAFLADPDSLFNLPRETIKHHCQRNGTYFQSSEAFETYLLSNFGDFPGGEVIYLEASWTDADFGANMNAEPSLFVVHVPEGTAILKNLDGQFKGLVIADNVEHQRGDIEILGAMHVFRRVTLGSPIGVTRASLEYSSGVLEDLPRVPHYAIKAWRDVPGVSINLGDPPPDEEEPGGPPGGGLQ